MAWAITPEDRAKYTAVFEGLNPENGKLSGETVRPVLMKSGLEVAKEGFKCFPETVRLLIAMKVSPSPVWE